MRTTYIAVILLMFILAAIYLPRLFRGGGINAVNPTLVNSSLSSISSLVTPTGGLNISLALKFVGGLNKTLIESIGLKAELGNLNESLSLLRLYYGKALSMETTNYSEAKVWARRGLNLVPVVYGSWLNASRELVRASPSLNAVVEAINKSLLTQLESINQTLINILKSSPTSISPYSPSTLQINATRTVKWGFPILINGELTGPPHRPLTIIMGNITRNVVTGVNGSFSVMIGTDSLMPGNYSIMLYAPPYMGNAPASAEVNVAIIGEPVHLVIEAGTALAGSTLSLRGSVSPWIPGNSTLLVSIDGVNETIIIDSPIIDTTVPVPVTVGTGRHILTVTLLPRLPMASASSSVTITILNPLQLSLPPIAVAGVAALIILESRKKRTTLHEEASEVEERILSAAGGRALGEGGRQLVHDLAEALYAVGREVGRQLMPNQTLREYFALVGPKMDSAKQEALWRLITLAEPVLYFTHEPTNNELMEARELSRKVIGN